MKFILTNPSSYARKKSGYIGHMDKQHDKDLCLQIDDRTMTYRLAFANTTYLPIPEYKETEHI